MKQPWRGYYNAICGDWVAKHNRTTRNWVGNCSSKTGSRRQSEKKTILKHFLKGFLEGKSLAPKWRKSADKSLSQPSCSHSNTIYEIQLQKTIVLRMQPKQEATLQSHLHCGKDPTVANHNGIPSTTHPAAPLAIPFTLRERSYSCKSQWNSVDHTCTKNSWNPIYNAEPIRDRSEDDPNISEHDPTTHETVSQPSHRRGRSSRFGDALCMEKHTVSCICYLSKTHFVRDFLQNSIGNSSTSTTCNAIYSEGTILKLQITCNSTSNSSTSNTCNPIYNAGTILQLQITMEFCRPHMHEKQLKPHLQCGTDPRPIRGWSEPIRAWSDHTRDRLAPVAL